MKIPEIKIINNVEYTKTKEYTNFVQYKSKDGVCECFSYFELQEEEMKKKKQENIEKDTYNRPQLVRELYKKYHKVFTKNALKDIVRNNTKEVAEQIARLIYEDETIYSID